MARIQRDAIRQLAARLFGLEGESSASDVDDLVLLVAEVGRRGEFEFLREQGIIAIQAARERTAAAGQFPHLVINAPNVGAGLKYDLILTKVELFNTGAGSIFRMFVGTQLGSSNSAIVTARDARCTTDWLTDFSGQYIVADGETAVSPPAIGRWAWTRAVGVNVGVVWEGGLLLRPQVSPAQNDQVAFQSSVLAGQMGYSVQGLLVPVAGQG